MTGDYMAVLNIIEKIPSEIKDEFIKLSFIDLSQSYDEIRDKEILVCLAVIANKYEDKLGGIPNKDALVAEFGKSFPDKRFEDCKSYFSPNVNTMYRQMAIYSSLARSADKDSSTVFKKVRVLFLFNKYTKGVKDFKGFWKPYFERKVPAEAQPTVNAIKKLITSKYYELRKEETINYKELNYEFFKDLLGKDEILFKQVN